MIKLRLMTIPCRFGAGWLWSMPQIRVSIMNCTVQIFIPSEYVARGIAFSISNLVSYLHV